MQTDGQASDPLNELLAGIESAIGAPTTLQKRQLAVIGELRDRFQRERLHLAALGQFKRGKSTLLNALMGADILPAAVTPLTAIPTVLAAGRQPIIRERFLSGEEKETVLPDVAALARELSLRVTEEANPNNRLGLERIEAQLPASILDHGILLIDTPGIGSTFRHNTKMTEDFLPACDAALFVVSPDPPITEVEIAFLVRVQAAVARVVIVLNKVDVIEPDELDKALAFLRRTLAERGGLKSDVPIFCVSARKALRARLAGDVATFASTGCPELERYLLDVLAREKQGILRNAVAKKALVVLDELRLAQELQVQAMRLPLDKLDRCIETFSRAAQQFRSQHQATMDLLEGDHRRLLDEIEDHAGELRTRAFAALSAEVETLTKREADISMLRQAIAVHIPPLFEAEREQFNADIESKLGDIFAEHIRKFKDLSLLIRRTASKLLDARFQPLPEIETVTLRHEPYWVETGQALTLSATSGEFLRQFVPHSIRRSRVRKTLVEEADRIVTRNVENLRWATRQNVEDAFRTFQARLDQALDDSIEMTRSALAGALEQRRMQTAEAQDAIGTAEKAKERLAVLRAHLAQLAAEMTLSEIPILDRETETNIIDAR